MTNNHALIHATQVGEENALLETLVNQLHDLTERVAVIEAAQSHQHGTSETPNARPPARARQGDPHINRQSGWQPTRR